MLSTKKTRLKEIMKHPEAVAILEKYTPGCTKNPALKMAYNFDMETISNYAPKDFKPEDLPKIDEELKALGDL